MDFYPHFSDSSLPDLIHCLSRGTPMEVLAQKTGVVLVYFYFYFFMHEMLSVHVLNIAVSCEIAAILVCLCCLVV